MQQASSSNGERIRSGAPRLNGRTALYEIEGSIRDLVPSITFCHDLAIRFGAEADLVELPEMDEALQFFFDLGLDVHELRAVRERARRG